MFLFFRFMGLIGFRGFGVGTAQGLGFEGVGFMGYKGSGL